MVYFFSFNKNVENYVESVNKTCKEYWNLQEFYRLVINNSDFEVFHNKMIVKIISIIFYKLYKMPVN